MSHGRGRPTKVMPVHPNLVLTRSLKTSLSTALYIQRSIKNKNTAHLYESSKRIWQRAKASYHRSKQRGHSDLSGLTNAEKNIRKNSLQMLFEIAAAYGNTEVRRVKSSDKSVGPLNHRLNIGGAALRNFAMTQFPFPDREPLLGFVGDVYGYPGNSLCHEFVPIHNLPELDFIDSCRKHIQSEDSCAASCIKDLLPVLRPQHLEDKLTLKFLNEFTDWRLKPLIIPLRPIIKNLFLVHGVLDFILASPTLLFFRPKSLSLRCF